jgi:hypothetical protein
MLIDSVYVRVIEICQVNRVGILNPTGFRNAVNNTTMEAGKTAIAVEVDIATILGMLRTRI